MGDPSDNGGRQKNGKKRRNKRETRTLGSTSKVKFVHCGHIQYKGDTLGKVQIGRDIQIIGEG